MEKRGSILVFGVLAGDGECFPLAPANECNILSLLGNQFQKQLDTPLWSAITA